MPIGPEQASAIAVAGASARVDHPVAALFKVGEQVRVRNINPSAHTRMPRYVRGKLGRIERDHGVFVFPDSHAAGQGEKPQHVYVVRFSARELWGPQANARDQLLIDLWDDYLEHA
jgi:nitrile hydratase beta subunit